MAAAGAILFIGVVGVLDLSLVPRRFDDTFWALQPSNDGPDFVTIYTHESGAVPAYAVVIDRLGGREQLKARTPVRKDAWSTTLHVGDREVPLTPPAVLYEYLGALVLLVATAMWRWSRRPRAGDG